MKQQVNKRTDAPKKVAILGGGICGLALAYYLQKHSCDITIFEAQDRLGGWLRTHSHEGALFECGPRTLRETSNELFQLIQELGLDSQMLITADDAKKRYIVHEGRLEAIPHSLSSLLFSKLGRKLLYCLVKEPFSQKSSDDDESVYSFFHRRIGKEGADTFLSALCAGIYGSSPHLLSMRSCFASLWEDEQKYGSLVKASFFSKKQKKARSFTFKEGIEVLPKRLLQKIKATIFVNKEVRLVKPAGSKVLVEADTIYEFDHLFSTITPAVFARMLPDSSSIKPLLEIPTTSLVTISVAYKEAVAIPPAFGFLCPEHEDSMLLGIVFDSSLFPEQNGPYATRLSLMMGGSRCKELVAFSDEVLTALMQASLQKYLNITKAPDYQHITRAPNAISRYPVGHYRTVRELHANGGPITLLGSGLYGVSVGDSVTSAYNVAHQYGS